MYLPNLERLARELEGRVAAQERQARERKLATRYHMVRFFDRQKLTRALRQAERKLAEAGERGSADLELRVAALREDLDYVVNFPAGEVYVSVVKAADSEAQARVRVLKDMIRDAQAEKAALTEADEGAGRHGTAVERKAGSFFAAAGRDGDGDDFFAFDGESGDAGRQGAPIPGPSPEEEVGKRARATGRDVSTSGRQAAQGAAESWPRSGQAGRPGRARRAAAAGGGGGGGRPPKSSVPARGGSEPRAGDGWRGGAETDGRPRRDDDWRKARRGDGGGAHLSGGRGDPRGGKKRERKPADPAADAKAAQAAEKALQKKQRQERAEAGLPMRTRAEGGRKRRRRK